MTTASNAIKDVLDNWIEAQIGLTSFAKASNHSEWEANGTCWGTNQPLASSGIFARTLFAKLSWKSEWGNKCNLTLTGDKMVPVSCDATIGGWAASYADLARAKALNDVKVKFKLIGDTASREAKINALFDQAQELAPTSPAPSLSPSPTLLEENRPNDSSSSISASSGEQTAATSSPTLEESLEVNSNNSEKPTSVVHTQKDSEPINSPPSARKGVIKRFIYFWILFGWLSFLCELIKKKNS